MIVEFTGCSGTGKTVMYKYIYDIVDKSAHSVFNPLDIVLGRSIAGRINSECYQNAILDGVALPYFIFNIHKFHTFFLFCLKIVKTNAISRLQKMLLVRSVIRKLGLYEFLSQKRFEKKIILVDEGTFHIAHIIFINGRGLFTDTAIHKFEQMVPRPDLIVFVQAPLRSIIERTEQRSDKPIRNVNSKQLEKFIIKGDKLFQMIHKDSRRKEKIIIINNSGNMQNEVSILANKVVDSIIITLRDKYDKADSGIIG
jgi:thymidylate kinase